MGRVSVEFPGLRFEFKVFAVLSTAGVIGAGLVTPWALLGLLVVLPIVVMGTQDLFQRKHAIRRNFPFLGRMRYWLEAIRPEIYQYFVENNADGVPFPREERSVVYQRAKNVMSTLPFGTQQDVYKAGYQWVNHSLTPKHLHHTDMRVTIGGPDCKKPYSASLLNVSAMSFGALSNNAVLSLNGGAKLGKFAHNTGEGSISQWHKAPGGDLIWQIGTGYFGCRKYEDGTFSEAMFTKNAKLDNVKMIEIKLSQGAKPGHGGILPAAKLTEEIAGIRGVPMGKDVNSPPSHSAFSTPRGLLEFVKTLRELSGGKPIGFKLCVGKRREFLAICRAMEVTGITPDFIAVDGGEGGTGAAPLEFSNYIGCPLTEALVFVHNALIGYDVRDKIKVIASGKITTAFGIVSKIAIGADLCYSARAMMMALGCIQAVKCNTNMCPVGITTQDQRLVVGLDVESKTQRVFNYHHSTLETVSEIVGAMGLEHTDQLRPWHLMRRIGPFEVKHYGELFKYLKPGELLEENEEDLPLGWGRAVKAANPESFSHARPDK
jgi:glutamate synthase domain-containing protein 2